MLRGISLFLSLILSLSVYAQVGHGGKPLFKSGGQLKSALSVMKSSEEEKVRFTPPTFEDIRIDLESVQKGRPLTFAYPHLVDLTPYNSGVTDVLDDGRLIWQLTLSSPGAHSLNLIFDQFRMAEGDSLFIYNSTGSYILGAFTSETNKSWGGLATAPIPDDEIVVEWRGAKLGGDEGSVIEIGAVNHDFLNIFKLMKDVGDFGSSASCHTDFSCFDDAIIVQNGKSTGEVIVNGKDYCTGTLMNNSNNDGTPYVLTAAHCLGSTVEAENIVFVMNYEVPGCQENIQASQIRSLSGSQLRAFADQLDFALLEMTERPPAYYEAVYAGWNRVEIPEQGVRTVHHPNGDVKAVAIANDPPFNDTFNSSTYLGNNFLSNSHWRVARYNVGATEPGSSGAGLFLADGKLIGHLSGGAASCSSPENDYFVRFNKIWDYYSENDKRVDYWLNPSGDGRTKLESFDPFYGSVARLSHFSKEMVPQIKNISAGIGAWTGINSEGVVSIAEQFDEIASAKIYGVFVMPGLNATLGDGKINIKVWSGIDEPAYVIGEKSVSLNDTVNKEFLVLFDQPVLASGPFFVGYDLDYTAPVDQWAVYQAEAANGDNTLMLKTSDGWAKYNALSGDVPSLAWIDILVSDVVFTDSTSATVSADNFMLVPNPVEKDANILYPEDGAGVITIYDLNGKPVYSKNVLIYNNQYRLSNIGDQIAPGVYLIQLEKEGEKVVRKMMVK
jgi:lysyl endopeptidase